MDFLFYSHVFTFSLVCSGADLLAVNGDGNMAYDLCNDEQTLIYIENEMTRRGITQDLVEDTRAIPENDMLRDLENLVASGGDLEFRDPVTGATPVSSLTCIKK